MTTVSNNEYVDLDAFDMTEIFIAECGHTFDNAVDRYMHSEDCDSCYINGYSN